MADLQLSKPASASANVDYTSGDDVGPTEAADAAHIWKAIDSDELTELDSHSSSISSVASLPDGTVVVSPGTKASARTNQLSLQSKRIASVSISDDDYDNDDDDDDESGWDEPTPAERAANARAEAAAARVRAREAEEARLRGLFRKRPASEYAVARAQSTGLLWQLLNPDPRMFALSHAYRAGLSTDNVAGLPGAQRMWAQRLAEDDAARRLSVSTPIPAGHPYHLPPAGASTTLRTQRRAMLQSELSESLRLNLLWEHRVNRAPAPRRRGVLGDAGALRPLTALEQPRSSEQQDAEARREALLQRQRTFHASLRAKEFQAQTQPR
jgi:hypothetical protein